MAGIHIPHLCYLKGINDIGACRVCVVELVGNDRLVPSCNTAVEEGMQVLTNSPRVRETRRINVQLLLSQHDCHCAPVCAAATVFCKTFQQSEHHRIPYEKKVPPTRWNRDFPLQRDASKCVKCMRCIQICDKVQTLNVWDVAATGSRTTVDVSYNRKITECGLRSVRPVHHPLPGGRSASPGRYRQSLCRLGGSGYHHGGSSGARRAGRLGRIPRAGPQQSHGRTDGGRSAAHRL